MVKKGTKKTFVRINLLVRASASTLYATLLLATARFTAQLLADAPSRRQNSYSLVWLRHRAYGGRVALLIVVACRWLVVISVTGDKVTADWESVIVRRKSNQRFNSVELCASESLCSFSRKLCVVCLIPL